MSEYECKRCGVIFDVKKNLVQHLKKKKECISINSDSSREALLKDIIEKEGVECEGCGKKYSNIYNMRRHRCKGVLDVMKEEVIVDIEKKIKELQKELKEVKKESIKQVANTIDNSTTNNDNSTNNITNNIQNITVVINDIDSINGIDYILKDPKFVEKILKWETDKKGLLKYMDEKYYNPKRPENRGRRKLDNESIELRMMGDWRKCDNRTALENIIDSLRIDWDTIIGRMRDDYWDEYDSNKREMVVFKREVSDPLYMELDITDDEEEKDEGGKVLVYVEERNKYVDEVIVEKGKEWKNRIMKSVK